jgi:hypothetical protein
MSGHPFFDIYLHHWIISSMSAEKNSTMPCHSHSFLCPGLDGVLCVQQKFLDRGQLRRMLWPEQRDARQGMEGKNRLQVLIDIKNQKFKSHENKKNGFWNQGRENQNKLQRGHCWTAWSIGLALGLYYSWLSCNSKNLAFSFCLLSLTHECR